MQTETVTVDGIRFVRYPDSDRRNDRVYYKGHVPGKGIRYLHRYLWRREHGPIPDGHHVHHLDGDPLNNALENLVCMPGRRHMSKHSKQWHEEHPEESAAHWAKAVEAAPPWHSSPEGKAWHSKNGKLSWEMRDPVGYVCEQCGTHFASLKRGKVRFCSNACKSAWRRAAGIDDEERVCEACGKTFRINKYRKTRVCSRTCSCRATPRGFVKSLQSDS